MNIKKDDTVRVMTGKDRGKQGRIYPRPAHARVASWSTASAGRRRPRAPPAHAARGQQLSQGGIIDTELFIDISNVQIVCPACGEPTRVGYRIDGDDKFRVCRKCDATSRSRHGER